MADDEQVEDGKEQFENREFDEAQQAISTSLNYGLNIWNRLQLLTNIALKSQATFTKEEEANLKSIEDKLLSRLIDAHKARGNARLTVQNEPISLMKTRVHLQYTDQFIAEAKELLNQYETKINRHIPEQRRLPSPNL